MNARSLRRRYGPVVLAVLAPLLLTALASGQQQMVAPPWGTHAFRWHLHNWYNLKPVPTVADLKLVKPSETVLIVFGDLTVLDEIDSPPGALKDFIARGGSVLIASDRQEDTRLSAFNVTIAGDPAKVPLRWEEPDFQPIRIPVTAPDGQIHIVEQWRWIAERDTTFKGWVAPPLIKLVFSDERVIHVPRHLWEQHPAERYLESDDWILAKDCIGNKHPIFANCTKGIVAYNSSFIRRGAGSDTKLLSCFPPFPSPARFPPPGRLWEPAFIVGADRVLIMASHTPFTNSPPTHRDTTDNLTFMTNTLTWLTDNRQRKHALFVDNGLVVTDFDVPLVDIEITPEMFNAILRQAENINFANQLLLDYLPKQTLLRVLLVVGLVAMTFYGLWRFAAARFRQDDSVPLVEAKLAQAEADQLPPMVRRQRIRLQANNFLEAACVVARECFERDGRPPPGRPVVVAGTPAERHELQWAVDKLWALAQGAVDTEALPVDSFAAVVRLAARVKAGLARGALRFGS
jgi:hypothetical protein